MRAAITDACIVSGILAFLICIAVAAVAGGDYVFAVIFIAMILISAVLTIEYIHKETNNEQESKHHSQIH